MNCNRYTFHQLNGALRVSLVTPRPWKVHVGQYVYIWIPDISFWSFLQSHPYMISWWETTREGTSRELFLLMRLKRGFTQHLAERTGDSDLWAYIDGPYGPRDDIHYGTVLLFATGIGTAALIPFVKQLLEAFHDARVCITKIILVLQLDKES